jgi:hypothetical protein
VPSQERLVDEEQRRENFRQETVLAHSNNELDNCPAGHIIEVHGFFFPPERLSPAKDP